MGGRESECRSGVDRGVSEDEKLHKLAGGGNECEGDSVSIGSDAS